MDLQKFHLSIIIKEIGGKKTMSCIHNETILENLYDEVWEEYRIENNLTSDQLDALDQNSELGYLPVIANEANRRFEELCR